MEHTYGESQRCIHNFSPSPFKSPVVLPTRQGIFFFLYPTFSIFYLPLFYSFPPLLSQSLYLTAFILILSSNNLYHTVNGTACVVTRFGWTFPWLRWVVLVIPDHARRPTSRKVPNPRSLYPRLHPNLNLLGLLRVAFATYEKHASDEPSHLPADLPLRGMPFEFVTSPTKNKTRCGQAYASTDRPKQYSAPKRSAIRIVTQLYEAEFLTDALTNLIDHKSLRTSLRDGL